MVSRVQTRLLERPRNQTLTLSLPSVSPSILSLRFSRIYRLFRRYQHRQPGPQKAEPQCSRISRFITGHSCLRLRHNYELKCLNCHKMHRGLGSKTKENVYLCLIIAVFRPLCLKDMLEFLLHPLFPVIIL